MPKQSIALKNKASKSSKREMIQAFFARRIQDIAAFTLMGSGIFLLLSFLTYNESDPSRNAAQIGEAQNVQNIFGVFGSYTADFFLQTFGFAAFLICIVCGVWGYRLWKREKFGYMPLRVIGILFALLAFAIFFARVPSGGFLPHPFAGGAGGTLMLTNIGNALMPLLGDTAIWASVVVAFLLGLLSVSIAVPVRRSDWANIIGFIKKYVLLGLGAIGAALAWVRHYNNPEAREQRVKEIKAKTAPAIKTPPRVDNDEEDKKAEDIAVVAPKLLKVKAAPKKSKQGQLSFEDGKWEFPDTSLMDELPQNFDEAIDEMSLRNNAELLQQVLTDYNVEGEIKSIHPGPVVTLYELEPAPGVKSSRIIGLADDIARSMSAVSVRASVIPGRNVIGIEIPNKKRQIVYMREMLELPEYENSKAKLPMILGKDIGGKPVIVDLAKMPHLLVAGTTGSGKSVGVNTMIMSLLYKLSPEKCRLIMIDPKMLELSVYNDIPHLLSEVVTEPGRAVVALKWAVAEMENRYRAMSKIGVRNIDGYNARMEEARKKGEIIMRKVQTGFDSESGKPVYEDQPMDMAELPYIVIIVDEFADLMLVAGKDVEAAIQRLAQMARAAGIHLIMATQRPSVDVITGVVKANFPTRISFQVTSKIDSRTILGDGGAEQLLGMGDMLYMAGGGRLTRVHGPFTSDEDVESVVNFLKDQGAPDYLDEVTEGGDMENALDLLGMGEGGSGDDVDELYDQAVALVAREKKASTSYIQRYFKIGYNRAANIIDQMEAQGVVGPANHVGKREILVGDHSE